MTIIAICPHCGQPFEIDGVALTETQRDIYAVLRQLYHAGDRIKTTVVADFAGYVPRTVRYNLLALQRAGIVEHRKRAPHHTRRAWYMARPPTHTTIACVA